MSEKFKEYMLNELVKGHKIHVKQLDRVTFLGFASGMMRQARGKIVTTKEYAKHEGHFPLWDRLVKQGLLSKKDLGDDVYEYGLTKKGIKLANELSDSGELYNPGMIKFKV
jgi:hypothetical protein